MSKAIGEVTRIDGEFIVKAGDGTLKILAPGTLLYEDDVIQGRGGSRELEIELVNGDTLVVGGDEVVTLSESVISKEPFTPEETKVDIEPIIAKVEANEWVMNADPEVINGPIIPERFVARTFIDHMDNGDLNGALGNQGDGSEEDVYRGGVDLDQDTNDVTATGVSAAEAASDAAVADLLTAANNAADAANSAISAANTASTTLAANTNPSAQDIQTAQDAISAAEAAISAAQSAASAYQSAASAAGESVEATTAVGTTDNAQSIVSSVEEAFEQAAAEAAALLADNAEAPTLSNMSVDAVREITEERTVVDTEATEAAGIYERDGEYFKSESHEVATNTVDVVALREMGYTLGTDGNIYTINNNGAKVQIEQEATKTVTKVVAVDPIMKTATEATNVMVAGDEFEKNPGTIVKNTTQTIDLGVSTKNIEIDFNAFTSGSMKVEFLNNGQVINTITQSPAGNQSVGYGFGQEFDSVRLTASTKNITVESIKGREAAQEVTVEAGGDIPDTEAMAAAGITWVDTVSQTIVQTPTNTGSETNDLQNIGNAGNNNVKGFNPEDREVSQIFDFGSALAFQKVSITVDLTVAGSWDYNSSSTKDILTVSANGEPLQTYNYTSSNTDYNAAVSRGESVEKIGAKIYTYDIYLDENGQAQLEFMVASTATDEVINVKSITANYEGFTGYVQSVQENETYMETVFVDAPDTLVNPADIAGGVPMMMTTQQVEVEADPIMMTQEVVVGYEYDISYEVGLSDNDGSETLSALTLDNLPDGIELQANGETIAANEDGSYTLDTQANSTVSMTLVTTEPMTSEQFGSVSASVTSTDNDDASTATTTVTGDSESISFSGLSEMVESASEEGGEALSPEIGLGEIFTLDQDPNVALFEEDLTASTATPMSSDTSSSTPAELNDLYVDNSDAGMSVEAPIEIAAT